MLRLSSTILGGYRQNKAWKHLNSRNCFRWQTCRMCMLRYPGGTIVRSRHRHLKMCIHSLHVSSRLSAQSAVYGDQIFLLYRKSGNMRKCSKPPGNGTFFLLMAWHGCWDNLHGICGGNNQTLQADKEISTQHAE